MLDLPRVSRVLVTGVNGAIGKQVFERLELLDIEVIGTTNHVIKEALTEKAARKIYYYDLASPTGILDILPLVNTVVHCAAKNRQPRFETSRDRDLDYKINVEGTKQLVNACIEAGVERFVYISSIKVHGEFTRKGEIFSETSPYNPQSNYAKDKVAVELFLKTVANEFPLGCIILRPVALNKMRMRLLNSKFLRWFITRVPLPFGKINCSRSSVTMETVIDVIMVCIFTNMKINGSLILASAEKENIKGILSGLRSSSALNIKMFDVNILLLRALLFPWLGWRRTCSIVESLEVNYSNCEALLMNNNALVRLIKNDEYQ